MLNEQLETRVAERTATLTAEIAEHKRAEVRFQHLNTVLRAIRNINQLITRERMPQKLIEQACIELTETWGYASAWICVVDQARRVTLAASSGVANCLGDPMDSIRKGEHPRCLTLLEQDGVTSGAALDVCCDGCGWTARGPGEDRMVVRLEHAGTLHGMLAVSSTARHAADPEEQALLREVAGDVALTLNNIEEEARRRRAEAELALQKRIADIFLTVPDDEMFNEVLSVTLEVMESPLGVFGYLDEAGALVVPTMTRQVWDQCQVPGKTIVFPRDTWGDSSWPRAVREKKPNYSNDISTRTPQGHVAVTRHISVPILFRGEVVGLFQVANKPANYTEADVRALETISGYVAPILSARMRRERAEEALREANANLERRIAERTEALQRQSDHLDDLVMERTAELARSRELLVEAQAAAHVGSWEWDAVSDEITGSAEFYRLFGVGQEQIAHFPQFIAYLHPDDRERVQQSVTDALEQSSPYDTDYRVRLPEGEWRYLNARGQVFADEHGQPLRMVGTCLDITDRKRAEDTLAENEVRYQTLVENIPQKIFMKDRNYRWVSINENFARDLGLRPEEVVGKMDADLFLPELAAKYHGDDVRIMETGQTEELEERYVQEGKETWVNTVKTPVKGANGEIVGVLGVFWDITERKRAQEQVRRSLADLQRSNQELEQFAYVASHDLQEPLRMVASYTQLLAEKYEGQLDDKAKKYIDYAVDGAVRMQRLINDLLTYSRISTKGKPPEPTDSHAVLGEALRNLQAAVEESGAMVTNDDLPVVRADATQLLQLLQNLIANAVKFRGAGSPRVHVAVRDVGHEWEFSVKDNGIGIDAQYADRVFVIFQRLHTRPEYPGTGIGLAMCKRIVERHGGRIWFESEPGKGSTFFFTVPK